MAVKYSPADILAQLLINGGQASDTTESGVPAGSWPVYANGEPDTPDSVITIYNTASKLYNRNFIDQEVGGADGFQVRVRAATALLAQDKAESIRNWLATHSTRVGVSIGSTGSYYLVHCCVMFGSLIPIGKETPASKRSIVTFNAMVVTTDQSH